MVVAGESVEDATELAAGEGYLAALGVYHEIHCLVSPMSLRIWVKSKAVVVFDNLHTRLTELETHAILPLQRDLLSEHHCCSTRIP